MIFFTGDTHFGHANIIKYCNRPFSSARQMDECLIEIWNRIVRPGDIVYHLGDFAFCDRNRALEILSQLNGKKIICRGNHDKLLKDGAIREQFEKIVDYLEIYVDDNSLEQKRQMIVLSHYAFLVWNKRHYGSWMLHGHSHGSLQYPAGHTRIMDVGVDACNFQPISYEQVKEKMLSMPSPEILDHHA